MEQILSHEFLDVYRITDGVLLNVKKYKLPDHHWGYHKYKNDKKLMKKLDGLKNLYRVTKDVDDEWRPLKVGDIIYNYNKITPVNNYLEYRFEIKTTGECFSGGYVLFGSYLAEINMIIEKYKLDVK